MKPIVALMMIAAVAWVFWDIKQADRTQDAKDAQAQEAIGKVEANEARLEATAQAEEKAKETQAAIDAAPHLELVGSVLQHLHDGSLLVHATYWVKDGLKEGDYALSGYPIADDVADGAPVHCMAAALGTYQYETVDGATRTIYELAYANPPQPNNSPGAWMWSRPGSN